ncbi:MAG: prolyl oligopeptidase family serine peptidase [bacterium]
MRRLLLVLAIVGVIAVALVIALEIRADRRASSSELESAFPADTVVGPTTYGAYNVRVIVDQGTRFHYQVYLPRRFTSRKHWPVIIALHGSTQKGRDNRQQIEPPGFAAILRDSSAANNAITIFPQNPVGMRGPRFNTAILGMLDATLREFHADSARVYFTGVSYGGILGYDLVSRFPERFAAFVPVSGDVSVGWTMDGRSVPRDSAFEVVAAGLKTVPVWAFHGGADSQVPTDNARHIVDAMRKAGVNIQYTEYPGKGHSIWDEAYRTPELYTWMFAQHR